MTEKKKDQASETIGKQRKEGSPRKESVGNTGKGGAKKTAGPPSKSNS